VLRNLNRSVVPESVFVAFIYSLTTCALRSNRTRVYIIRCSEREERPFPVGPKPVRQHPEELVKRAEFWSGLPTLQYGELLAKRQILQK
jgi:hypothetical protein